MYNFNDYEIMREPKEVDPECEYIYVTDNPKYQNETKVWKVIVDKDLDKLPSAFDKVFTVRYNPFKYCTTDTVIEMDGSIQIYKKLDQLYNDFTASGCELGVIVHPLRFSIIKEYEIWKICRKYPEEKKQKCLKAMTAMGYDFNYKGLYEMTVRIVKKTNRNKIIDEATFELLKKLGGDKIDRLDQPVYSFLLNHLYNDTSVFPMSEQIIHSEYMKWCLHRKTNVNPMLANTDIRNEGFLFNKLVKLYKLYEYDLKTLKKTKKIEDAIISLTSWKKRINTVSYTIYSLLKKCPGFDIVLTLSEDEFPDKEKELPRDLLDLAKNGFVEILWVKENTYTFKKMLPTMKKYPNKAIITADDGCRYYRNYAQELYNLSIVNPGKIISYNGWVKFGVTNGGGGSGILFPAGCFKDYKLTQKIIDTKHDDYYYGCLSKLAGIEWHIINDKPRNSNFESIDSRTNVSNDYYKTEMNLCKVILDELDMK